MVRGLGARRARVVRRAGNHVSLVHARHRASGARAHATIAQRDIAFSMSARLSATRTAAIMKEAAHVLAEFVRAHDLHLVELVCAVRRAACGETLFVSASAVCA